MKLTGDGVEGGRRDARRTEVGEEDLGEGPAAADDDVLEL